MIVYTVGHSTRSAADFLALLRSRGITGLADVRTVPRSRRHPHFSQEVLSGVLAGEGIQYQHFADLGGLRKPRPDSRNGGWRHDSFRGYADHMATAEFAGAIQHLRTFARKFAVAVMCAESKWWQCHRQLIADALTAGGVEVQHIMSPTSAPRHELTPFARVSGAIVEYPALFDGTVD